MQNFVIWRRIVVVDIVDVVDVVDARAELH